MDDIFILVPSNADFSCLLSLVNLVRHCIQLTFESENENSLSFGFQNTSTGS